MHHILIELLAKCDVAVVVTVVGGVVDAAVGVAVVNVDAEISILIDL